MTDTLTDPTHAAQRLAEGLLVAFPTETVYGLGADATNSDAVAAVFEAKQRPAFDPLIVHVPDAEAVPSVVAEWPQNAAKLAEVFWPGPLTLVLPKQDHISDLVTSGLPQVGVRVPAHPLAQQLLRTVGRPVVAPSANPFGRISPTTAEHVIDGLSGRISAVLDGGPCAVGLESTVVSLTQETPVVLRPGGLAIDRIESVVGTVKVAKANAALDDAAQPAPGMLSRHYAPKTLLRLVELDEDIAPVPGKTCGLLTHGESAGTPWDGQNVHFEHVISLGDTKDLPACATNFFASLRSLDASGLDVIIARKFPPAGLGIALNDRLRRAAAR